MQHAWAARSGSVCAVHAEHAPPNPLVSSLPLALTTGAMMCWFSGGAAPPPLLTPSPPPPPPPRPDASFVQPGTPLRFFAGAVAWGPGELEQQLEQGVWRCAGASRSLVLKHARQLEVPLWRELTDLMQQQPEGAQPAAT